jgi:hypothetical protein
MQPHRIKVGAGVVLLSIEGLARDWGVPVSGIEHLMATFSIPAIKLPGGDTRYVSLYPLEMALFDAGLPGVYKGTTELVKAHHELAGVLYGTLSREVIRERCKSLARSIRGGPPAKARSRKKRS